MGALGEYLPGFLYLENKSQRGSLGERTGQPAPQAEMRECSRAQGPLCNGPIGEGHCISRAWRALGRADGGEEEAGCPVFSEEDNSERLLLLKSDVSTSASAAELPQLLNPAHARCEHLGSGQSCELVLGVFQPLAGTHVPETETLGNVGSPCLVGAFCFWSLCFSEL